MIQQYFNILGHLMANTFWTALGTSSLAAVVITTGIHMA
jgi:hypothetical protein